MSEYLSSVGKELHRIRALLNWTQEKLAEHIGVSRVTIIGIERGTTKLTKAYALALFTAIQAELSLRRERAKELDYSEWADADARDVFMYRLTTRLGLTASALTTSLLVIDSDAQRSLLPIFGPVDKVSSLKGDKYNEKMLRSVVSAALDQIEEAIAMCLELNRVESLEFVKSIQD